MKFPSWPVMTLIGICVILAGAAGYLGYRGHRLDTELLETHSRLSSTTASLAAASTTIAQMYEESDELSTALERAKQKNDAYASQVSSLNHNVDTLTKLTTIDPELLAKYSKVYFLNDNYVPDAIATITPEFTLEKGRTYSFESKAYPFLDNLLADANDDDVHLLVASAYRSFGEQSDLKASYRFTYGAGTANSFSADQGYSEHQLGTTIDFTTKELAGDFSGFEASDAYAWLNDNAYKYGFVISYPKDNGYYTFEPWHWRFVGIKLATELHAKHEYFYDLDQRTIDSYLIYLFDL